MLDTNEKIQMNKLGFFLRLCKNQLTRKLIEEVLDQGVIKTDGLIKEMMDITRQNTLEEMISSCQFLQHVIRTNANKRFKDEQKLRIALNGLPWTIDEVHDQLLAFNSK